MKVALAIEIVPFEEAASKAIPPPLAVALLLTTVILLMVPFTPSHSNAPPSLPAVLLIK